MKFNFKEGDWCYHEFILKQIKKMENDKITEVSDGNFSTSSSDLSYSCYPLLMEIKSISDDVDYYWKKILALNFMSLNYPDIHCAFVNKWIKMCDNKDYTEKLKELYTELERFYKFIEDEVKEVRFLEYDSIKIFRT